VEIVESRTRKNFHSSGELMEILINDRKSNEPEKGGTGETGVEGE
jgi:hypothetical protein